MGRNPTLSEQAATWFVRVNSANCSTADRAAFEAWIAQSEAHGAEFRRFQAIWNAAGELPRPAPGKWRAHLAVGALALLLGAWLVWQTKLHETNLQTAAGEMRLVVLADGSEIELAPGSALSARLTLYDRRLVLHTGEAWIKVAHEAWRGFEVQAGSGVVRDVGTIFNVAMDGGEARVGVIEGAIELRLANVEPVRLSRGQQVRWHGPEIGEVRAADLAVVDAWRRGRLVFDDTPLAVVAAQLSRLHPRPVELASQALGQLRISGQFDASDRAGLLRALPLLLPVEVHETAAATVLAPRG